MPGFRAMGCDVVVEGADPERVRSLLAAYERKFSRFAADSELVRVNSDPREDLSVSALFARGVRVALDAARHTDGLVDATLGGARGAWRSVRLEGVVLRRPPGLKLPGRSVARDGSVAVDDAWARALSEDPARA